MTQRKQTPIGGEEEEALKRELRSLPRVSAPWYLESDILRRLRSGDAAKPWITRPVPAFAASALGVTILGGIGYFLYISLLTGTPQTTPSDIQTAPVTPVPAAQPQVQEKSQEIPQGTGPAGSGSRDSRTELAEPQPAPQPHESRQVRSTQQVAAVDSSSPAIPVSHPLDTATRLRTDSLRTRDTASSRPDRLPVAPLNPARRDSTH